MDQHHDDVFACLAKTSTTLITSSGGVDVNKSALSLSPFALKSRATKRDLTPSANLGVDPLRAHWRFASAAPQILRGGVPTDLDLIHQLRFRWR